MGRGRIQGSARALEDDEGWAVLVNKVPLEITRLTRTVQGMKKLIIVNPPGKCHGLSDCAGAMEFFPLDIIFPVNVGGFLRSPVPP